MSFACAPNPGRVVFEMRYPASAKEVVLTLATMAGYIPGLSDLHVTINSGVYLWSDNTAVPALSITGAAGDRVFIYNRGVIIGRGGNGGSVIFQGLDGGGVPINTVTPPTAAGHAMVLTGAAFEIENESGYIAGGGGGGGAASGNNFGGHAGGGGGAGGGVGGSVSGSNSADGVTSATGGAGGAIGLSGGNGTSHPSGYYYAGGGGGGRVVSGAVAAGRSNLGGLGGTGGGAGGSEQDAISFGTDPASAGGGGGGWGQAGGAGYYILDGSPAQVGTGGTGGGIIAGTDGTFTAGAFGPILYQAGAAGGKAISLVSGSRTFISGAARVYGASA